MDPRSSWVNLREDSARGMNFSKQLLEGSDFYAADCSGANFSFSVLTAANLAQGTYMGAVFQEAQLDGATLAGSNFGYTDMRGANLEGASDWGTQWEQANFQHCVLPCGLVYEAFLVDVVPAFFEDCQEIPKRLVTEKYWDTGLVAHAFPDGVPRKWASVARRIDSFWRFGQLRRRQLATILQDAGLVEPT